MPDATVASIGAKLASAIENVLTLRVTTIVGAIQVTDFDNTTDKAKIAFIAPGANTPATECATTSINLLAGDITQVRTEKFVTDPVYAKIHDDALTAARSIVSDNLAALKSALIGLEKFLPNPKNGA
jgi:hypothetical protein